MLANRRIYVNALWRGAMTSGTGVGLSGTSSWKKPGSERPCFAKYCELAWARASQTVAYAHAEEALLWVKLRAAETILYRVVLGYP